MTEFDIVILGAGLNGAALAAALRDGPHSVAVIEPALPTAPVEAWDARIYAYSPGNVEWIKSLGAWNDSMRAQAVYQMRIHGDDGGRLTFDALDAGLAELAWIGENGRLQAALWQTFVEHANVQVFKQPAVSVQWAEPGSAHRLSLADGAELQARLLVAADGANSWLRAQAGIGFAIEDYQHVGMVANFETEKPHRGCAYQWFRKDGVLAYLPLPGKRISMVWSTPPEHATELQALDPSELAHRVAEAGAHSLGELLCLSPAVGFPLKRRRAHEWVRPGLVLLGDTAHTVHPLAGQGVNLGFRDSRLLAEMLNSGGNPGAIGRLTAYAARRREDVQSMQFTTGSLKKLFDREDGLSRDLRNFGLNVTHHLDPLNQMLARHAIL